MMFKYIIIFGLIIFAGCKQLYEPEIDSQHSALVIQGILTTIPGEVKVKITQAVPFDSTNNPIPVRGSFVTIFDDNNQEFPLYEDENGSYSNTGLYGQENGSYFLKVVTPDGNIYQSDIQMMPRKYNQDSIYAELTSKSTLVPTGNGDYVKTEVKGIETYVNLSSGGTELPKCRYESRITMLYVYQLDKGAPPPTVYGWKSFNPNSKLNVTLSKFDRSIGVISKHSINFFGNKIGFYYIDNEDAVIAGWLLSLTKYNISTETQKYYLDIKNQIEASGKIFDPTPSQIIGNIKCITQPNKLVFGFFEVSNAEKLYYKYTYGTTNIPLISKGEFQGLSIDGESIDIPPPFWNN